MSDAKVVLTMGEARLALAGMVDSLVVRAGATRAEVAALRGRLAGHDLGPRAVEVEHEDRQPALSRDGKDPETGRRGDWMQTASGRMFWPLDPRPEEIHLEDIAHSLSHQCRFAGHCRTFYSVAEHCVRASLISSEPLPALLHDASEAYLVDLPRPVKRWSALGALYTEAEAAVQEAICARFGLPRGALETPEIHRVDEVVLLTEARDIMEKPPRAWRERSHRPLDEKIEPWSPATARALYLQRFGALAGR